MPEQQRTHGPLLRPGGGGGIWDDLAADDAASGAATIASGPYAERLPVAGMTVGEIRRRFGDRFDIHPESRPVVDGNEVGDDTILQRDQVLMFTRRAGEKGARPARGESS
jgi:hypothetical protein